MRYMVAGSVMVLLYKLLTLVCCSGLVVGANGWGSSRGRKCGCSELATMLSMRRACGSAVVSSVWTLRVLEM